MARSGTLPPRKRRLVAAMVSSRSVAQAAETANVSLRSAWRYLDDPEVRAALSAALDDALAQVTRRTVAAMTGALDTLEAVHEDRDSPPSARVSAARTIMQAGPKLREAGELTERIQALEDRIGGERAWRR